MALQPRQIAIYRDSMTVYRQSFSRDDMGDSQFGAYVYTNQPCKLYTTSNYDSGTDVASGLAGAQNILVADRLHYDASLNIRGGDFIQVTTELGAVFWYSVAGYGKERARSNVASVFVVICTPPDIDLS